MRISSSRHLKNWKPTPVSDFARHPYMLMNLGQRDEPLKSHKMCFMESDFKMFESHESPRQVYLGQVSSPVGTAGFIGLLAASPAVGGGRRRTSLLNAGFNRIFGTGCARPHPQDAVDQPTTTSPKPGGRTSDRCGSNFPVPRARAGMTADGAISPFGRRTKSTLLKHSDRGLRRTALGHFRLCRPFSGAAGQPQ